MLTPLSFVAWLVLSTAFPSWGGIAGAVVYAGFVAFELFALRDGAAKPMNTRKATGA